MTQAVSEWPFSVDANMQIMYATESIEMNYNRK